MSDVQTERIRAELERSDESLAAAKNFIMQYSMQRERFF